MSGGHRPLQCDTQGQAGIIIEPVFLALQWGVVFNHMAGNMSIKAYVELGGCVPSNCKQMLCWAHMSQVLTTSKTESLALCLLCAFSPCSFLLLFLCVTHHLCRHPTPTADTKLRSALFCSQVGVNIGCHGDTMTPKGYAG